MSGKEDVRLVVVEVVAHLAHVAWRLAENFGQSLTANRLVRVAIAVGLLPTGNPVVPSQSVLGDGVGRRVEVRSESEHARVNRLALGGAAEDVDDGILVVAPALDGVVDLRDDELDGILDGWELALVDVDDARLSRPVAGDGLGLRRGSLFVTIVVEVPEGALAFLGHCQAFETVNKNLRGRRRLSRAESI